MSTTNAKPKAPYTTKEQKQQFIKWYLEHYGMNTTNTVNNDNKYNKKVNPRILSDLYYEQFHILIPKMTIYRWLKRLDNCNANDVNDNKFTEVLTDFATTYINTNLLNINLPHSTSE